MASDLQKGQRESKASFGILAASLFISMVASLVLIVGSAKIETIALTSNHKDRIFSEKYLKYLKIVEFSGRERRVSGHLS